MTDGSITIESFDNPVIHTQTQHVVNLFTRCAKPHSVFPNCLVKNPAAMTANHFWSDSIVFGSSTKTFGAPEVCYSVFLLICVWWDTARNKEPVVWSWCGVTLTQSSPETLHPPLQVTAPADWYPTGILWLYRGEESELCEWQYMQVVTRPYPITHLLTLVMFGRAVRTFNQIITFRLKQWDDLQSKCKV